MGVLGTAVAADDLPWETWDDPVLAAQSGVRWRMIFCGRRTPTGVMSMGLSEVKPCGILPLHRHTPAEIYHVLDGEGILQVEGVPHALKAGVSVFVPAGALHRTTCVGDKPLRFLFVFPTDSFEDVDYQFVERLDAAPLPDVRDGDRIDQNWLQTPPPPAAANDPGQETPALAC